MIFGYARCSTNENKQDLNRQVRELKELGATDKTIYKEFITGSANVKVEFEKLLGAIEEGDTLAVTEVSRISRSTKQLCEIIELVQERKLKLIIKDSITIDCTRGEIDPMTKAFLQMSGVFAELEKNMISQRVKSGMANAKAKGKRIGRPDLNVDDITGNDKFMNAYKLWKSKSIKKIDIQRLTFRCIVSYYRNRNRFSFLIPKVIICMRNRSSTSCNTCNSCVIIFVLNIYACSILTIKCPIMITTIPSTSS